MCKQIYIICLSGLCLGGLLSSQALAQQQGPAKINISGALFTPIGAPITSNKVNFRVELWDKTATCLLYVENHDNEDLTYTKGSFSLQIGTGTGQVNYLETSTAFTSKLFQNTNAGTGAFTGCASGVTLSAGDDRLIRVYYDVDATGTYTAMAPDVPVTAVPYVMVAETIQGKTPANLVMTNINTSLVQPNFENLFSSVNYPLLTALISGASTKFYSSAPTVSVDFNSQNLVNVADPSSPSDVATKAYVDSKLGGRDVSTAGIAHGLGGGLTLVWSQVQNKWIVGAVGSITQVGTGNGLVGGPITLAGTIAVDAGTSANKIVQLDSSARLPGVDGSQLSNMNVATIGGSSVSTVAPTAGQVLIFNSSANFWQAQAQPGITDLSGDVSATGPGSAVATINNDSVTSAKISNTNMAVNRLLITDSSAGNTVTYATCASVGQLLQWTSTGWICTDVSAVLGNSGVVAGSYGSTTQVGQITTDAQGRVTALTNVNINFPVTSVAGRTGAISLSYTDIAGLGNLATKNFGTAAGELVELDGTAHIPSGVMPTVTGTITEVAAGNGLNGGGTIGAVTLNVDVGTSANKILQVDSSGKLPAVDGSLLTNANATSYQGRAISSAAASGGQALTWNASTSVWEPQALPAAPVSSVAGRVGAVTLDIGDFGSAPGKYFTYAPNNVACTNLQTLSWDGTKWICADDQNAGGTITSVGTGVGLLGGTITLNGTISIDSGVTAGKILQLNSAGKIPAVDGSQLTSVTATYLGTRAVSMVAPTSGQVLQWNNTDGMWEASLNPGITALTSDVVGSGYGSVATTISNNAITADKINSSGGGKSMLLMTDGTAGANVTYASCGTNEVLSWTAGGWVCVTPNAGTLTNIQTSTGILGGPITTTATLTLDTGTAANQIVQLDASARLPNLDGSQLTNIDAAKIGTHSISSVNPIAGQYIGWNATTAQWEPKGTTLGTVTSIAGGTGVLGGPVTSSGALSLDTGTSANQILQLNASAQIPAVDGFLVSNINAMNLSTRAVSANAPIGGQLLAWNTSSAAWEPGSKTGGTVTQVNSGSGLLGGPINSNGTLNVDIGTTANQVVQLDSSARLPGVDGSQVTNTNAVTIGTHSISTSNATTGQFIGWNATSSQWEPVTRPVGTVTQISTGNGIVGGPINGNGTLNLDVGTGANQLIQLNATAQIPAIDGFLVTNFNAVKFSGFDVSAVAPVGGQVLTWNATTSVWAARNPALGTVTYIGTGNGFTGGPISSTGMISVDVGTTSSKIVQLTASAGLPAVDGSQVTNVNAVTVGTRVVSTLAPAVGQYLAWNATTSQWEPTTKSSGTLTSLNSGNGLIGGPITSNGTLAIDAGVGANQIIQITSGSQIPAVDGNLVTNVNAVKLQTRDVSSNAPAGGQLLAWNQTTSVWEPSTKTGGTVSSISSGTGLTGGPIQDVGTFNVDVGVGANQIVQLTPSAGLPGLDGSQVTNVNAVRIGTRVVATFAPAAGQYLAWNTTTSQWEPSSKSAGTVTQISSGIGLTGGPISNNGTLNVDVGTTASKILQLTSTSQIPGLDAFLVSNMNAIRLQGRSLSAASPASGQIIGWNGTTSVWEPTTKTGGSITYIGTGTAILGGAIQNAGTLSIDVGTGSNQIVQLTSAAKLPAVDGSLLNNVNANRIGLHDVATTAPAVGQYFGWNQTTSIWEPTDKTSGSVTSITAGAGVLGGTIQTNGTFALDTGTTASKIIQLNAAAKIPAVDGSLATNANAVRLQSQNISSATPATGQIFGWNSTISMWEPRGGAGSVTQVTGGVGFVAGTVNGNGTLDLDVGTTANKIIQLTSASLIPAVDGSNVSNTNATRIGTRTIATTAPAAGQFLAWNATTSVWEPGAKSAGTVTQVNSGLGLTGGPINGIGTLNVDVGTTASKIIQLTSGSQIPAVNGSLVSNFNAFQLQGRYVSNSTPVVGQVLGWNSTTVQWEPLYAATGTVTSVKAGNAMLGGTINSAGTLAVDVGVGANQVVQLNSTSQIPALDGSQITNLNAQRIGTNTIAAFNPIAGQYLAWNGTTVQWEPTNKSVGTVAQINSGIGLTGGPITNNGTLNVDVGTAANQIIQLNASSQIPAVDGSLISNTNVINLQSRSVSANSPTTGQVLAWNATTSQWQPINSSNGTLQNLTAGNGLTGGSINGIGTISVDVGTTASKIVQMTAAGNLPAVDGFLLTNMNAVQLQTRAVSNASPAGGQILVWNSTLATWAPTDTAVGTVNTVVAGTGLVGGSINGVGTLAVDVGTAANQIIQVNSSGLLPSLDASNVTNINATRIGTFNISTSLPVAGQFIGWNATTAQWEPLIKPPGAVSAVTGGTGLVGGTINGVGTLSVDVGTTANKVLQLSSTAQFPGVDATPLTNLNLQSIQSRKISSAAPIQGQLLGWNNSTSQWEPSSVGSGTVTNIAGGTGVLGGPITTVGTLSLDTGVGVNKIVQLDSNAQMPAADGFKMTNINAEQLKGREVSTNTPAGGQVLIWNATNLEWTPLSAATGTVTSILGGVGILGGTITSSGTFAVDVGTTASKILQLDTNGVLPALSGTLLTNVNPDRIGTRDISSSAPVNGQLMGWNAATTTWEPMTRILVTNLKSGVGLLGGTITATGTLTVDVGTTATKILQLNASGALPAVSGFLLTNVDAISIQGKAVSTVDPTDGQFLQYNATTATYAPVSMGGDATMTAGGVVTFPNAFVRGGNSWGSDAIIGNKDTNQPFSIIVNNTLAMNLSNLNARVAIGTISYGGTALQVGGISTTQTNPGVGANYGEMNIATDNGYFSFGSASVTPWGSWLQGHSGGSAMEIVLNPVDGNVGIGTLSPRSTLDVTSNVAAVSAMRVFNLSTTGYSNANFYDSNGTAVGYVGYSNISSGFFNTKSYLGSAGATDLLLTTGGNARMIVQADGTVGIGTSAPVAALDVYGLGNLSSMVVPRDTTANRPTTLVGGMIRYNTSTSKFEAYQASAWFNINAPGVTSFLNLGNDLYNTTNHIGIGTATPFAMLDVYDKSGDSALIVPRDLASNRPPNALNGMLRYASDTDNFEAYVNGNWLNVPDDRFTFGVANQGTGLTSGTSGGMLFFNSTSSLDSTGVLTNHAVIVGGGAGNAPYTLPTGSSGNAFNSAGAGADINVGAIDFSNTSAISGILPIANGGLGSNVLATARTNLGAATPGANSSITQLTNLSAAPITMDEGGTGLKLGVTGGILGFNDTGMVSSALLTRYGVMYGGGANATPSAAMTVVTGWLLTSNGTGAPPAMKQLNLATSAAITGTLSISKAGTGLTSGTPGGILYFNSTSALASSAALNNNEIWVGQGAGLPPTTIANGTDDYFLLSNGAGSLPTWGTMDLQTAPGLTGNLTVTHGGTGTSTGSLFGVGSITISSDANSDLIVNPSGTGRTILGSQVGIGSSAPIAQVHIANTANPLTNVGDASNYTMLLQNTDDTVGNGTGIGMVDFNFTTTSSVNVGGSVVYKRTNANAQGELRFYTKQSATNGIAPVQAMVIADNGNVGINTGTPSTPLSVNGIIAAQGSLTITGSPATIASKTGWKFGLFSNTNAIGIGNYTMAFLTPRWLSIYSGNPVNDATATVDDTNAAVSFSNTGTGYVSHVGIGTNSPNASYMIHVYKAGTSVANALVESSGGAGNTAGYRAHTFSGAPAAAYTQFGAVDNGSDVSRAAIFVPNAGNNGVIEGVTVLPGSGNMGINTVNPRAALEVNGTGQMSSIILPRDTTPNRPATLVAGMIRYNTTLNQIEYWNGLAWRNMLTAGLVGNLSGSGSTLTGGLTITAGGESLTGGLNNNGDGITNAGNISGFSSLGFLGAVTISAGGTSKSVTLKPSTSGSVLLGNANGTGLEVADGGASTVNYVTIKGAPAGGSPTISTAGADANINLTFSPKGIDDNLFPSATNVGIGTSSPTNPLEVNGVIKTKLGGLYFADGTIMTTGTATRSGFTSTGNLSFGSDSGAVGTGDVIFKTKNIERGRIKNNGFFALGTASPGSYFDIFGNNTQAVARMTDGTTSLLFSPGRYYDGSWQTGAGKANIGNATVGQNFNFSDELDITSGSLAIGTTAAAGALDVRGSGNIIFHAGSVAIGGTSPAANLDLRDTTTATSGNAILTSITLKGQPASASTGSYFGQYNYIDTTGIGAFNLTTGRGAYILAKNGATTGSTVTNLRGRESIAQNSSTAPVTTMMGSYSQATNSTTGAVPTAMGTYSAITNSSTGPITNAYAFLVDVTGSSITNAYGMYIASAGGVTKSYGIYQAGSADDDYFAGQVSIGVASTPLTELGIKQPATTGIGLIAKGGSSNTDDHVQFKSSAGATQSVIDSAGNWGILNTNPGYAVEVTGIVKSTGTGGFISTSDRRLKTNIETARGLASVTKLRGVSFNWISDGKPELGTIAQEVEEVFPEAVETHPKTGLKGVKYLGLVGPLIEADKELNGICEMSLKQNEDLGTRIAALSQAQDDDQRTVEEMEKENAQLKEAINALDREISTLEKQN